MSENVCISLCLYVCMHVYVCVFECACVYVCACTCMCVYFCLCVLVRVCGYVCICVCLSVRTRLCARVFHFLPRPSHLKMLNICIGRKQSPNTMTTATSILAAFFLLSACSSTSVPLLSIIGCLWRLRSATMKP